MPDCVVQAKGGAWRVRFLHGCEVLFGPSFRVRMEAVSMSLWMRRWVMEAGSRFSLIALQIYVANKLKCMGDSCSVVDPQVFAEKLGYCSQAELYALRGEDTEECRAARKRAKKINRRMAKTLVRQFSKLAIEPEKLHPKSDVMMVPW